jgi:hypothetical protein
LKPSPERTREQEKALLRNLLKDERLGSRIDPAATESCIDRHEPDLNGRNAGLDGGKVVEHSKSETKRGSSFLRGLRYALTAVLVPTIAGTLFPAKIAYILTAHHRPTVIVKGVEFTQPGCQLFMITVGPKYLDKRIDYLELSMKFSGRILSYGYGTDTEVSESKATLADHFQVSADCKVQVFSNELPSYLQIRMPGEGHRILQVESNRLDATASFMLFVATTPEVNPFPEISGRAVYTAWGQELSAPIQAIKAKSNVIDVKQLPPIP